MFLVRGPVQARKHVPVPRHEPLQDVQKAGADAEHQNFVVLPVPQPQQLLQRRELPAVPRRRQALEIAVGAVRAAQHPSVLAQRHLRHERLDLELVRVRLRERGVGF